MGCCYELVALVINYKKDEACYDKKIFAYWYGCQA